MIKLTVITVCYNAAPFIQFTLDSVANQTFNDFEYLIIDGNSKDFTLRIINENKFRFKNLKLISEKDNGIYDAMNKAQNQANGEYILFLNAGDELASNDVLQNILVEIEKECDVIISDTIYLNENRKEIGLRSKVTPHNLPVFLSWKDFKYGMKICHQSFVTKKALTKPFILNNLSADLDWEISILKKSKKIGFLNNPISKYLLGGISDKKHNESLKGRFEVLTKHFGLGNTILNHFWIFLRAFLFKIKN